VCLCACVFVCGCDWAIDPALTCESVLKNSPGVPARYRSHPSLCALLGGRADRSFCADQHHVCDKLPFTQSSVARSNIIRRRHHCRMCGKVACGVCSAQALPIPYLNNKTVCPPGCTIAVDAGENGDGGSLRGKLWAYEGRTDGIGRVV